MEIIRTERLTKLFQTKSGFFAKKEEIRAVDNININVQTDTVFSVVGESGSGKSTLARLILKLMKPTDGEIFYRGERLKGLNREGIRRFRRSVQIIFQDPYASLNPRMTVYSILSEPLKIHGFAGKGDLKERVTELLRSVGMLPDQMNRYPHEFSGGQRQRICIARALTLSPELIVADEPLSSLDVSIQAQILNLLAKLKDSYKLSFIFISHDLNVIRYFSDYVAVMYAGNIVEEGISTDLFDSPKHPYTQTLIEAIPEIGSSKMRSRWTGSDSDDEKTGDHFNNTSKSGCSFYNRCPVRRSVCLEHIPLLEQRDGRKVACHLY